jgi:hypothetical protein
MSNIKSQLKTRCWWLMLVILATWEAEIRGIYVQGQPRQIVCETLTPQIARAKWTGGVTQTAESACKGRALSSNPNTIKKKTQ